MKAIYAHFAGALGLTFVLAACIPPSPEPTPAPERTPAAQDPVPQISVPAAGPDPVYDDWMDAPRTPGDWTYSRDGQKTSAVYGTGNSPIETAFILTCDSPARTITIARGIRGANDASNLIIRTETADRTLRAQPRVSHNPLLVAQLATTDPLLDAMALTKGRFAVETPGLPTLYLPAWAEVTRVIEDCR